MRLTPRIAQNTGWALLIGPAATGLFAAFGYPTPAVLVTTGILTVSSLLLVFLGKGWLTISETDGPDIVSVFPDHRLQDTLEEKAADPRLATVDILAAQGISRRSFVIDMVRHKHRRVRLQIRDPRHAPSSQQRTTAIKSAYDIMSQLQDDPIAAQNFELYFYRDIPSVRITILRDAEGQPLYVSLGWYCHKDSGRTIGGSRYPAILFTLKSPYLPEFALTEFNAKLSGATRIDFALVQKLFFEEFPDGAPETKSSLSLTTDEYTP